MTTPTDHRLRGVYAILDTGSLTRNPLHAAEQALAGGARLLQYRDKSQSTQQRTADACALKSLCTQYNALLIINDDIELAKHCQADGVHLGRDDCGIAEARNKLGQQAIIGISCYNDFARAEYAQAQGANYIAFGAMYPSPTKPQAIKADIDLIHQAKQSLSIPVCAIGGITLKNAPPLIAAGVDMLAIISGIFNQANIHTATEAIALLFHD